MNLLSTALITASVVFSTVVPVYAQNTYPVRNADVGGGKILIYNNKTIPQTGFGRIQQLL